jgi:plastocyanin
MRITGRSTISGALLVVLAACSGNDSNGNSTPPPDAITINLVSSPLPAFQPAVDTIAAGGTVTWQWDAGTHDVTAFSVAGSPTFLDVPDHTGVQAPQTIIGVAGTYHFFCSNHGTNLCPPGDMCGVIVAQ